MLDLPAEVWRRVKTGPIWKSLFRHGYPDSRKNQSLAVFTNVFLHLHPVKVRRSGVRMSYTWCMGGTSFFLFLVETVTGLLLMFYYRPTIEYAFTDIMDLREQAPRPVEHAGVVERAAAAEPARTGGKRHGEARRFEHGDRRLRRLRVEELREGVGEEDDG